MIAIEEGEDVEGKVGYARRGGERGHVHAQEVRGLGSGGRRRSQGEDKEGRRRMRGRKKGGVLEVGGGM